MNNFPFTLREEPRSSDVVSVDEIVRSTGFFRDEEVAIATELVTERLSKGPQSGYEFLFADDRERPVAYSCYGRIAGTASSYDLYWIATHQEYRNRGIGGILLRVTEEKIWQLGGRAIYIETSSRELYQPTRQFYEKNGYSLKACFEDFYDVGDDKVVYVKISPSDP